MSAGEVTSVLAALAAIAGTCVATIAVELTLAVLLFGVRNRDQAIVVALAQVATNPVVEFGCLMLAWSPTDPLASPSWAGILALEVAAIVVEVCLYRVSDTFERPWLASIVLNLASFGLGCVVGLVVA